MSIQMTAVSPRRTVGSASDPFKKYWWAIVLGFVVTAGWLFLPALEAPVGSGHYDSSKGAPNPNAEQSLDAVEAGNGAQGGAIDLSMDGAKKRKDKSEESFESMLYQPAPEAAAAAAAPGAPLSASSGSLAQQLKDVGAASKITEKKDAAGWTEKAQSGFASPHLGSSSLSGGSSAGGGGSSASAGGNAFGTSAAQVSMGATHGLKDDGGDKTAIGGMAALRGAAKAATAAANSRSNDAARAGSGAMFDGSKGRNAAIGGGPDIAGASYAALDAAPANLKLNDPKLDEKKLEAPPAKIDTSASSDNTKQMMMMMATMVIGGLVGGPAGSMIMMAGPMMMQQQAANAAADKSQQQSAAAAGRMNNATGGK
jgi:hypothetical protein